MTNQPNVGYFVATVKPDLHHQTSSRQGSSRGASPKTLERESLLTSSMRLIVLEIQLHDESTECWLFCCDRKTRPTPPNIVPARQQQGSQPKDSRKRISTHFVDAAHSPGDP